MQEYLPSQLAVVSSLLGHEQTWRLKFVAVTGQLAVGSRLGSIPFSWAGLFQEKTEQNISRIFVLVPRGGVRLFAVFNSLACPTFANRPIESQ